MANIKGKRWPYIVCVVLQTVIFGSGNVLTKFAYESISPLWCLSIRFGLAALVFAALFGPRIVKQLRRARLRDWLPAALCMGAVYLFCNVALGLTTATNVGFLVALPVVFTPIVASLVFRRRYPRMLIPFQVAVVAGLYLLCSNGGSFSFGWGELFAVLSSLSLAGALVFSQDALEKLDAVAISGAQIGVTFLMALACALAFEAPVDVAAVQPVAWGAIAFLALFSTCLTFALQNISLVGLPSSTVSLLLTGEPVLTALFSWLWLGETLAGMGGAGAALIVGAVVGATCLEERRASGGVADPSESGVGLPDAGVTAFEAEGLAERRALVGDQAA